MTVNGIGDEGAKVMSEMLKMNKTLKELHLFGEEERKTKRMNHQRMIENEIGVEGAKAFCEMLKVNTTLTTLNLSGKYERNVKKDDGESRTIFGSQETGLELKGQVYSVKSSK